MTEHVRISEGQRRRLKTIRDGKSYTETLAALLGRWHGANVNVETVDTTSVSNEKATTIRVSSDCHAMLVDAKEAMGSESLGAAVDALIRIWQM